MQSIVFEKFEVDILIVDYIFIFKNMFVYAQSTLFKKKKLRSK